MNRRSFLGFFSGIVAWLTTTKVEGVAAFVVTPKKEIPDWCPDGWIPLMGQTITKDKYPHLFTVRKQAGRDKFIPVYYKQDEVKLPKIQPSVLSAVRALGWQDNLTRIIRSSPDTRVGVCCMSTKPLQWSNGRPAPAGFMNTFLVERAEFEKFYGPILEDNKMHMWYSSYEDPQFSNTKEQTL